MVREARMTSSVSTKSAAHGVRDAVGEFEVHRRQLTLKCLDAVWGIARLGSRSRMRCSSARSWPAVTTLARPMG